MDIMTERRSVRARKEVDYAKFGLCGDDSPSFIDGDHDDDFADATPPPPKKNRKEKLCTKKDKKTNKKTKERPSLDDKLFDRDLQLALELSTKEKAQQEVCVDIESHVLWPPKLNCEVETIPTSKPEKHFLDAPILTKVSNIEKENMNLSDVDTGVIDASGIELLEEDVQSPLRNSKGKKQKPKYHFSSDSEDSASDSEFRPVDEESPQESDDDFCPDDDSDFDGSTKKSKSKVKKSPVKTTKSTQPKPRAMKKPAVSAPVLPLVNSRATTKITPAKTTGVVGKPLRISSESPGMGLSKKFNPPASIGKSPIASASDLQIKSPSSGLRLGLSRNVRLKPLHSNVKLPT